MGMMSLLTVFLVMIMIIIIQFSTGGSDSTEIRTEINKPAPQRRLKGQMGLGDHTLCLCKRDEKVPKLACSGS